MEFQLLGPVVCLGPDGAPLPIGRAQERCVLAVLLLAHGRAVPVGRLIELLWDGRPPRLARSMVYTHVARLRGKLQAVDAATHGVRLVTRPAGYAIEVPAELVDVHRFTRLVAPPPAGVAPADRAARLREALGLWRGPALADAATDLARAQLVRGLDEQRLAAEEELAEIELGSGRHQSWIPALTELVARHPLRERPAGLLMRALYRAGRQAEALAVYRAARQRLVEELGLEPGPELRRLEQAILAQDPALDPAPDPGGTAEPARAGARPEGTAEPARADARPAGPPGVPSRWRGPRSPLTTIVGREPEIAALRTLLTGHRLVTVVGVGGIGKTTLALHAAEAATRPVTVVQVGPLRTAAEVVLAVAAPFGAGGNTVAGALDGLEQILAGRPELLLLDGCEHLLDSCAELVRQLLSAAPDLVVLATSRAPLGLPEETVWRPDPLLTPALGEPLRADVPAVALLLRRAQESVPGFDPDAADLAAVGRICRRVDGLPLALELAASRLRDLPPAVLADRLERDLAALAAGSGRPDPITTVVDGAYQQLSAAQARLLARLSVFRGSFPAPLAAAVCAGDPVPAEQVPATLTALADRSLIQPFTGETGARRYRLLEVVREYAAARLAEQEKPTDVADRHLQHWLEVARETAREPLTDDRFRAWHALQPELQNLRAALEHGFGDGDPVTAAELTVLLFDCWELNGVEAEEDRWYALAAPYLPRCPPPIRAQADFDRGCLLLGHEDYLGALQLIRRALPELARHQLPDHPEAIIAEGRVLTRLLDPAGLPLARAQSRVLSGTADPYRRQHAVIMLAEALLVWGHYQEARELCARHAPDFAGASRQNLVRLLITTCLAELGTGDLAAAAGTETRLRAARAQLGILHPAPPRIAAATFALATAGGSASDRIAALVPEADRAGTPRLSRSYPLLILLAEAERRAGQTAAARRHLANGLRHGLAGSDFSLTLPGVVVAALLAQDAGDRRASRRLAGGWEVLRRRLGLPAPLEYAAPVRDELGLDPAAPGASDPTYAWNPGELRDLIHRAYAWCAGPDPLPG